MASFVFFVFAFFVFDIAQDKQTPSSGRTYELFGANRDMYVYAVVGDGFYTHLLKKLYTTY